MKITNIKFYFVLSFVTDSACKILVVCIASLNLINKFC